MHYNNCTPMNKSNKSFSITRKHFSRMRTDRAVTRMRSDRVALRLIVDSMTDCNSMPFGARRAYCAVVSVSVKSSAA